MTYFEESSKRGERSDEWTRFDEYIRRTPLIDRLAQVDTIINELSRDGRPPKMSIPAQPTDEDVFINFTLLHVAEVLQLAAESETPCDLEIECDALRDKEARLLSRAMGGRIESRELPDGTYEHAVKETLMQWTTEFPTKIGVYWIRNYVRRWAKSSIVKGPQSVFLAIDLATDDDGLMLQFPGTEITLSLDEIASAEWYGPIEPPE
jgi:hypothetical protein